MFKKLKSDIFVFLKNLLKPINWLLKEKAINLIVGNWSKINL